MEIDYLHNHAEYIETVSEWIYYEFVQPAPGRAALKRINDTFAQAGIDLFPVSFVAVEGGECVGTASLFENDLKMQWEFTPWLAAVYVRPDCRNRGIGKQLVQRVLEKARSLGYHTVYLRTENACEYYKGLGWLFLYRTQDETAQETEVYRFDLNPN